MLVSGGYHDEPISGWQKLTRRPYGVFGNGFESMAKMPDEIAANLNAAQFVYGRETFSAETLRRFGIKAPGLTFCPDSTFGLDLRDEKSADELLARTGLERGKFICEIPNLSHTPHWKLYGWQPAEKDLLGEKMNEEFKAQDHAAVREMIVAWMRQTRLKVLACPEMSYQMALAKKQWIAPLPDDVKPHVARQSKFWMPDEAAAVYARARDREPRMSLAHHRPGRQHARHSHPAPDRYAQNTNVTRHRRRRMAARSRCPGRHEADRAGARHPRRSRHSPPQGESGDGTRQLDLPGGLRTSRGGTARMKALQAMNGDAGQTPATADEINLPYNSLGIYT